MPSPRRSRRVSGCIAIVAGLVAGSGAAMAEFENCAVIENSLASPFIQSRTQISILNLESSQGNRCNLLEFRTARVTKTPVVEMVDSVQRSTWEELWGVSMCDRPVAYQIWYKEIGLGGVSFHVEEIKNPAPDVIAMIEAAAPAAPAEKGKEAAATTGPRILSVTKPIMRGHDVCAVQRALLSEGLDVVVDGVYGPGSKKAVGQFQKRYEIKPDGVVGTSTRAALAFREPPLAENSQAAPKSE